MFFLSVIPFLLYLANTAVALQCYECDSSRGVSCNFGLLSFAQNVKDCQADSGFLGGIIPSSCNKIVAIDKNGNEYVARGCTVNTGSLNTCQAVAKVMQFSVPDQQSIDCYTCDTDKCNSAPNLGGFSIVGVLTACFLYLFF